MAGCRLRTAGATGMSGAFLSFPSGAYEPLPQIFPPRRRPGDGGRGRRVAPRSRSRARRHHRASRPILRGPARARSARCHAATLARGRSRAALRRKDRRAGSGRAIEHGFVRPAGGSVDHADRTGLRADGVPTGRPGTPRTMDDQGLRAPRSRSSLAARRGVANSAVDGRTPPRVLGQQQSREFRFDERRAVGRRAARRGRLDAPALVRGHRRFSSAA